MSTWSVVSLWPPSPWLHQPPPSSPWLRPLLSADALRAAYTPLGASLTVDRATLSHAPSPPVLMQVRFVTRQPRAFFDSLDVEQMQRQFVVLERHEVSFTDFRPIKLGKWNKEDSSYVPQYAAPNAVRPAAMGVPSRCAASVAASPFPGHPPPPVPFASKALSLQRSLASSTLRLQCPFASSAHA